MVVLRILVTRQEELLFESFDIVPLPLVQRPFLAHFLHLVLVSVAHESHAVVALVVEHSVVDGKVTKGVAVIGHIVPPLVGRGVRTAAVPRGSLVAPSEVVRRVVSLQRGVAAAHLGAHVDGDGVLLHVDQSRVHHFAVDLHHGHVIRGSFQ